MPDEVRPPAWALGEELCRSLHHRAGVVRPLAGLGAAACRAAYLGSRPHAFIFFSFMFLVGRNRKGSHFSQAVCKTKQKGDIRTRAGILHPRKCSLRSRARPRPPPVLCSRAELRTTASTWAASGKGRSADESERGGHAPLRGSAGPLSDDTELAVHARPAAGRGGRGRQSPRGARRGGRTCPVSRASPGRGLPRGTGRPRGSVSTAGARSHYTRAHPDRARTLARPRARQRNALAVPALHTPNRRGRSAHCPMNRRTPSPESPPKTGLAR